MERGISFDPIFFFDQPVKLPTVIIAPHRESWVSQMATVTRYSYKGYKPVIKDNLLAHTYRVIKRAGTLFYIAKEDVQAVVEYLVVHDVGEIGKDEDMTVVDKQLDTVAAKKSYEDEITTAKRLLSPVDFQLWLEYEKAKPALEGLSDPTEVDPNAILAKMVDVVENETYFHDWIKYLEGIYGVSAVRGMFPHKAFRITFPRLTKYRANLPNLKLPATHFTVIEEIFAEIEANGRVAGQIED